MGTDETTTGARPRFLLFSGDRYYPGGGVYDLKASSNSLAELRGLLDEAEPWQYDWAHIFDTELGQVWHRRKRESGEFHWLPPEHVPQACGPTDNADSRRGGE